MKIIEFILIVVSDAIYHLVSLEKLFLAKVESYRRSKVSGYYMCILKL